MPKNQWDRFESLEDEMFKNEVGAKLKQLDTRLEILAKVAEQQIDVLNNKVSALQQANELLLASLESSEGFNAVAMDKTRVDATLRVGLDMKNIGLGYEPFSAIGGNPIVTVYEGEIQIGDNSAVAVSETDVEILLDNTYVYVQYQISTKTATVQGSTTKPVSEEDYLKFPLCKVKKSGAYARIIKYYHIGNIIIPAVYADI